MANSIKVKLGYNQPNSTVPSDFTRIYVINDVPANALIDDSVKAAVHNFNVKMGESSIKPWNEFFVADDGGHCRGVVEVIGESTHEVTLMGGA